MPPNVDKSEFRHWCDTIDANLDAVHKLPFPEVLLDKVRRAEVEITAHNWPALLAAANEAVPVNKRILEAQARGEKPPGIDPWDAGKMVSLAETWIL